MSSRHDRWSDFAVKELAHFYKGSSTYRDHLSARPNTDFARFVTLVQRFAPVGGRILEVGCGTGQAAHMLAEAGLQVMASDLSPLFLAAAPASGNFIPFVAADVACLPFADETFDAVVSNEMVEHLPDVEVALDEMARVTRVGGVVILRSPALASPVWPLLDLPNLLRRQGGRPPHYTNLREAARFFVMNVARTIHIAFSDGPLFERRTPELSGAAGDSDAVYWSSSIELARYFARRGFGILNQVEFGLPFSRSWLVAKIAPWLSPAIALVAQRERK